MAGAASPRKRASLFDLLSARTTARKGPRTLWTASTPAFLSRLHVSETLEEHDGCVNTICWNSSGSLLVSGSDDCRICIWHCWDDRSAKLKAAVDTGHRRNIFCARFVPNSSDEQVVTTALDGQVRLTNVMTRDHRRLGASAQFVSKLEFLPQSNDVFLATGQDGHVTRYDLREPPRAGGEALVDLSAIGGCTTLAFAPDASGAFAIGCEDPMVRLYDVRKLAPGAPADATPTHAFCPRELVDSCGPRASYDRLGAGASGLAFSRSGELLVNLRGSDIFRFDGRLSLDALVAGVPTCTSVKATYRGRANNETFAKQVTFLFSDALVASGGDCGGLYVWHRESGRLALQLEADSQIVNCVCGHPTLPLVAVSGIDSDIKLLSPGEPTEDEAVRRACMRDTWSEQDVVQDLARARKLRLAGNAAFGRGDHHDAELRYRDALELLEIDECATSDARRDEMRKEKRNCHLNLAAAALRLGRYETVTSSCERVLQAEPDNVKALYRRAQSEVACPRPRPHYRGQTVAPPQLSP